ncbi:2-C-methyl-D-erythritol 4-phosphate cytidylyltransferase [Corynebacterium sp. YSMAA1_1_F7]|uniref:IspD/TarI family cytidylyltransferase n=1 Tax=Corynebacterium sp. YSMAA1_1_F7 TaxID=3383590 RepID=UPI0038D0B2E2
MTANVYALVAAAGSGTRLGFDTPKAFVELNGRSLLERSLDGLAASQSIDQAIVLVSENMRDHAERIVGDPINVAEWAPMTVSVELGGGERFDSVYAGLVAIQRRLSAAGEATEGRFVAVHDAARCLTPPAMIAEVVDRVCRGAADGSWYGAIPVLPVVDTIKVIDAPTSGPRAGQTVVEQTPDRASLRAAATPQVFDLEKLIEANEQYLRTTEISSAHAVDRVGASPLPLVTDDASLMEMAGFPVVAVDADPLAMKITTPQDYRVAQMILNGSEG